MIEMPAARLVMMKSLLGLSIAVLLPACSTSPKHVEVLAARMGLTRSVVQGTDFLHVMYFTQKFHPVSVLHVYIEGDGSPWLDMRTVSPDPTPRHPLMLHLMALDSSPSVYLGRPCYHGLATIPPCSPLLWTHERYSGKAVESMEAALNRVLMNYPDTRLVFLGHSGGGTLAMLLAGRFERTRAVVSLAGNLDTATWAEYHNYSPLTGSLNPAAQPDLDTRVLQRHYIGALDQRVPPAITKHVMATHPGMELVEFKNFDHTCCWQQVWPAILASLAADLADRGSKN
jgi:hypothetical protein